MKVTTIISAITFAAATAQAASIPAAADNKSPAGVHTNDFGHPGDGWDWCDSPQSRWDPRCSGHGGRGCRGNDWQCWCQDERNRWDERCRSQGGGGCRGDWNCCRTEQWRGNWDPSCRQPGPPQPPPGQGGCRWRHDMNFAQCCGWRWDNSCGNCRGNWQDRACH